MEKLIDLENKLKKTNEWLDKYWRFLDRAYGIFAKQNVLIPLVSLKGLCRSFVKAYQLPV